MFDATQQIVVEMEFEMQSNQILNYCTIVISLGPGKQKPFYICKQREIYYSFYVLLCAYKPVSGLNCERTKATGLPINRFGHMATR